MRLWTVVLFIIGLNFGFSVLNWAGVWCSWDDYSAVRITESGPVPYVCPAREGPGTLYTNSTNLSTRMGTVKGTDIGWGVLTGLPVVGSLMETAIVAGGSFGNFISLFTGIFTSIGDLMQNQLGFPPYIAWGIQGALDIVIFYGLLQFILGRSGKTVE
jgi:hypothetical protein